MRFLIRILILKDGGDLEPDLDPHQEAVLDPPQDFFPKKILT